MDMILLYGIIVGLLAIKGYGYDTETAKGFSTGEKRKSCSKLGTPKQPLNRVNTTSRLINLRQMMSNQIAIKEKPIDAYLVTSDDDHQSEYVAPYDRRRQYITGFSGSYGNAIITKKKAALWTDGRYHLQADEQINCDWLLMRMGYSVVPTMAEWLKDELPPNSRLGADPKLVSAELWQELEEDLTNTSIHLVEINVNVVDLIWEGHQEEFVDKPVHIWDIQYAGVNWTDKVKNVRERIKAEGANAMVVTALDEIAWMLNIRGRDIPYNPFVRSYVVLMEQDIYMYVNRTKLIKNNIAKFLDADFGAGPYSVQLKDYETIWADLPTLTQQWQKVILPSRCIYSAGASWKIYSLIPKEKRLPLQSPIIFMKAVKNKVEREGMRRAHIRDAAAMCEFMAYFESRIKAGDEWDELKVVTELNRIRFEQINCSGNSFSTIAGFGPNGALPHYEPSKTTNRVIFTNSTLVLDSGGQYFEGTTDVTRTIHLGEPTQREKDAYTRVLIGTIQYSTLTFPSNMSPSVADVLSRASLWEAGLDYLHGSGHGVGTYLGVHESPIAVKYDIPSYPLQEGYFLSNEPGYYNDFGVRLENVLEVISKPWLMHLESGEKFLGFNVVTLVPYEPKLIDTSLLSAQQIKWLNDYNAKIRILVGHELKLRNKTQAFYWMMEKTDYVAGKSTPMSTCFSLLYFVCTTISIHTLYSVLYS